MHTNELGVPLGRYTHKTLFKSIYLNPKIKAQYLATLHVVMPKPSCNLQIYVESIIAKFIK